MGIYTSLLGSNKTRNCREREGEGGLLKTRGTCELQEKRLLFRGFSGFMSLNMDHVHGRGGGGCIQTNLSCLKLYCNDREKHSDSEGGGGV